MLERCLDGARGGARSVLSAFGWGVGTLLSCTGEVALWGNMGGDVRLVRAWVWYRMCCCCTFGGWVLDAANGYGYDDGEGEEGREW